MSNNSGKKISEYKKSQASIFMIVGLIILIGGAVFFYSTQNVRDQLKPEIKIIEEQVPVEFDPVKVYANDCAYLVGVEGLKLIGKQGGYISFADKSLNKESLIIKQNPTESDAVSFTEDSDLKIPYWWHLKSANNCKGECRFASKKPELRQTENSIEKQLERYIDSRFKECLNDFEPFREQGYKISETGRIKTDVTIALNDVQVLIEYPLEIEKQDAKTKINQFLVRIPVNLNKIYDLSAKITNLEVKHRFLEKHVLNLLAAFSGVDRGRLPPMSEVQFKLGSSTSWQKSDVKNKITGLLASYIPLFQVDGTYNYERNTFDSELKQRLYDSTIIPVANSSFRDLSAYFTYLDFWPAYFDLNCKGENCIPSSANSLISFFGIQQYRFAYDLSFPVLVEVQDPFALNGQGYTLNFFLEGNIRNNKPMPADFAPLERGVLSERSLLCDTKTSGNVTLAIMDAATKKPIENAEILYTIIDESCFIGSTNAEGILKETLPVAVGGVLNIVKEGYLGKAVEFDPRAGFDADVNIEVQPISTKNLIVKKKNLVKTPQGWQFSNKAVDLNNKEFATVTLTRINNEGELDFSSIANYEGQQKEKSEIEITSGTYSADITLLLNEKVVIPDKQKCFRKGILGSKECFTVPKVDFGEKSSPGQERFSEGGLKMNLTLNSNELENHNTLVLYAISIDLASVPEKDRSIEDIEQLSKIDEYSSTYQLALQPAFE
ncbi:MAG: hypothetical protein AABX33_07710 [Nanoarchaeota archaeon]